MHIAARLVLEKAGFLPPPSFIDALEKKHNLSQYIERRLDQIEAIIDDAIEIALGLDPEFKHSFTEKEWQNAAVYLVKNNGIARSELLKMVYQRTTVQICYFCYFSDSYRLSAAAAMQRLIDNSRELSEAQKVSIILLPVQTSENFGGGQSVANLKMFLLKKSATRRYYPWCKTK